MTAQPFVPSRFPAAHLPETPASPTPPRPAPASGPRRARRRSHFFNGDLRRDGVRTQRAGGRPAERDGVTIISRRRWRRRRDGRQRRRGGDRGGGGADGRRFARDEPRLLRWTDTSAVQRHIILAPRIVAVALDDEPELPSL